MSSQLWVVILNEVKDPTYRPLLTIHSPLFCHTSPMPSASETTTRLNQLLSQANSVPISSQQGEKFHTYLILLQKWNTRTNLTSIRDEEGILSRHFLESILCARNLPPNIVSLLDFGAGAGFPGLPIAILRDDLQITLAESQNKKAAFLREAVRALNLKVIIHAARAEDLKCKYDCITLRAVDHMHQAVTDAQTLLNPAGWLAILTTTSSEPLIRESASANTSWQLLVPLCSNTNKILLLGQEL